MTATLPASAVPAPPSLKEQVDQLEPKLAYHVHRYGLGDDPLAMAQAKLLAAKAIQSYSPEAGASFGTWLDRNMQPLSRYKRQRATAVKVPEQIQIDAYRIEKARINFEDENGRDPEVDELADYAGMTPKRLNQVQQTFRKMSGEAAFENNLPSLMETDYANEALEALWDEADLRDRRILEHRAGYGGKPILEPKALAAKLNISPVELSRRSARLGAKLDEVMELLERHS